MRRTSQEITIHPFENMIVKLYELAKREMSSNNYQLFERYDKAMIGDTVATTRRGQLSIIVRLTRQINKDWNDVTKDDINKLVYDIMEKLREIQSKRIQGTSNSVSFSKVINAT
ncbi:MAG: hypothetical protein K8Q89_09520 [Nitrosarchaeum sp.]|nr:hypothetical protein [Nitrosarchaeum sp.]